MIVCENNIPKLLLGNSEIFPNPLKFNGDIIQYEDYNLMSRMVASPDYVSREIHTLLKKHNVHLTGKTGIESWHLPEIYFRNLFTGRSGNNSVVDISPTLLKMRRIKGTDEIEYIRKATGLLDLSYQAVKELIKVGITELELFSMFEDTVRDYCSKHMISLIPLKGGIVSGPRALNIGGPPTRRIIKQGNAIISDLQVAYNGYWSDMARTWIAGFRRIDDARRIRSTLLGALSNAEEILKSGTRTSDVFNIISKTIVKAGFNPLPHHAGHGLGLNDQEYPFLIPGSTDILRRDMVLSVEPGIYDKKSGYGIRIENIYLVKDGRPEEISWSSTQLT